MIFTLQDLQLKDKRVFLRTDFNVPLDESLKISDDSRICASLPTIHHLLGQSCKLIIGSHLGRPKGQFQPQFSLLPVAEYLAELLEQEVFFPEDCVGDAARKLVQDMEAGQVVLLENLRFHPGETSNDPEFARRLASFAQIYVNDAFGTLHRAHASTAGMVSLVPEKAMGFLIKKEINFLNQVMEAPKRPLVAILGGAKVSDKLGVIENLMKKADHLLIGGAMAYTFLQAKGVGTGSSLVETDKVRQAAKLLEQARLRGISINLPVDHVVAQGLKAKTPFNTTSGVEISEPWMGVDIGPKTVGQYGEVIGKAKTILWNGPMGAFEIAPFDQGTLALAKLVAKARVTSVVGGGDSVAAIKKAGVADKISHLSTGGGATLEYLEGKELPGLKALEKGF